MSSSTCPSLASLSDVVAGPIASSEPVPGAPPQPATLPLPSSNGRMRCCIPNAQCNNIFLPSGTKANHTVRCYPPGSSSTRAHRNCIKHHEARQTASSSQTDPAPLLRSIHPQTELSPSVCFQEYGFALLRATESSKRLAADIMRMSRATAGNNRTERITGNVQQLNLLKHQPFVDATTGSCSSSCTSSSSSSSASLSLLDRWRQLVVSQATSVGIDMTGRQVVAPKLLMSEPGHGEQVTHWDNLEGPESKHPITSAMFCSTGTFGTALPLFHKGLIKPGGAGSDPALMRPCIELLYPRFYESVEVFSGDMVLFDQCVPHYGVRNQSSETRVVLFSVLTAYAEPDEPIDEYQMFRWTYIQEAFSGRDANGQIIDALTPEYAAALVEDRAFNPLEKYTDLAALRSTERLLQQHGLLDLYYGREPPADYGPTKHARKRARTQR